MGLNNHVKGIINAVAKNDMDGARAHAKCILAEDSSKTNAEYRARMNKLLNQKGINMLQLPPNISKNALLEDVSTTFHEDRYYLTGQMQSLYHRIMRKRAVCFEMEQLGINSKNTTLLYGPPGTGKTEFGRYMAYKMGLPFLYLNFSQCIDSYMGGTAKNISGVFDFARDNECLLMLDEIDTVASNRSGSDNSGVDGERNRTTISIMQEFDRLQSRTVVIAATNRIDLLDEALLNRFTIKEEVSLPSADELLHVTECFYHSIQREIPHDFNIYKSQTQRELTNRMVERLAEDLATELEASGMLEEEEKPHLPIEVSEEVYQNIRSRTQQYVVLRGLNDVYVGAILDITKRSYNSNAKEYNRALVRTVKTLEPDFVYPIFWSTNESFKDTLFLQEGEKDKIIKFVPLKQSVRPQVAFCKDFGKIEGVTVNKEMTVLDKPIYAFQIDEQRVICGNSEKMLSFFESYSTSDVILDGQIKDFKEEIKKHENRKREKKVILGTKVLFRLDSGERYLFAVRLIKGTGRVILNGERISKNQKTKHFFDIIEKPFMVTNSMNKFDVICTTASREQCIQAEILSHGIANELSRMNFFNAGKLRRAGYIIKQGREQVLFINERHLNRKMRKQKEDKLLLLRKMRKRQREKFGDGIGIG